MTRDQMLSDAYTRFTSRKAILCLVSIVFAAYGYASGHLTYVEFQTAVFGAVTAFSIADAAAAFRPKPSGDAQTVNVGAEVVPAAPVKAKRVRVRKPKAKP